MASKQILVVIDPLTDDQLALTRAVHLAADLDASLRLFCCCYLTEEEMASYNSRKDAKHSHMAETSAWLNELAAPLKAQGLEVDCEAVWNQQWEVMVVQAAARVGAHLIVKSSFQHSAMTRRFARTSDVYLMRTASCPVLLVKSDDAWQNNIILAAVSLDASDDDAHGVLNNRILNYAHRLAKATEGELHLVSALENTPDLSAIFSSLEDEPEAPDEIAAQRFGVPISRMHVKPGNPKAAITEMAQTLHADVVIIGTVARTGLAATLLGNTAEKVLDAMDTDVMVVS
ncbi:universal stress protein [Simiduia agarivorans]|uniref:Universal stress protein UspE n=1 Tax=Simiduia agarivorans (strain DSM 21679 / JCM 13881 / BCRC 17597 / SA1) TaxID=1117647 RepID=R9S5Q9_SIMAS|nr:universal stress protein [Simiduia agarivorans]AGN11339.1 universal stress protein UspE [Simiduia agarivorans SA1 = DSM 21679]